MNVAQHVGPLSGSGTPAKLSGLQGKRCPGQACKPSRRGEAPTAWPHEAIAESLIRRPLQSPFRKEFTSRAPEETSGVLPNVHETSTYSDARPSPVVKKNLSEISSFALIALPATAAGAVADPLE